MRISRNSTAFLPVSFFIFLLGIRITCLILRGINLAVDLAGFQKLLMGSHGADAAAIHNDDTIRILHRGDPLGNDDLCRFRDKLPESLANQRIRAGIHSACGVIQNEDLGLFQQSTGDTEPLLLAAGNIASPLFDIGIVISGDVYKRQSSEIPGGSSLL